MEPSSVGIAHARVGRSMVDSVSATDTAARLIEVAHKLLAPKVVFALAIATGASLFAPDEFIRGLRLDTVREEYGFWIGVVCLVSWSLVAMHLVWYLGGVSKTRLSAWRRRRGRRKSLDNLTPTEKGFLQPYLPEKLATRYVEVGDGVADGLERQGVVYCPSRVYETHRKPLNLHCWARKYLKHHPKLLGGAEEYPPDEMDPYEQDAWES